MATPSGRSEGRSTATLRPAVVTFPVTLLLFFGAGVLGVWLADRVAPDSLLAPMLGLLALPLAFIVGMNSWLGLALFAALWSLLRRLLRSEPPAHVAATVPPGSFVFVPAATIISTLTGGVMALLATQVSALATLGLYLLVGLGYGILCWLCARSGYLPFPAE